MALASCDFSQIIPFILYISKCLDKQVQRRYISSTKCRFKSKIIVINLFVFISYKERRVVLVSMNFLHLLFECISLGYVWTTRNIAGRPLRPVLDADYFCTKANTVVRFTILTNWTPSLYKYACYQVPPNSW